MTAGARILAEVGWVLDPVLPKLRLRAFEAVVVGVARAGPRTEDARQVQQETGARECWAAARGGRWTVLADSGSGLLTKCDDVRGKAR